MLNRQRRRIVVLMGPLIVGLAGFYQFTQSPAFQAYRAVDIVRLTGFGMCFGVFTVGFIALFRKRRTEQPAEVSPPASARPYGGVSQEAAKGN